MLWVDFKTLLPKLKVIRRLIRQYLLARTQSPAAAAQNGPLVFHQTMVASVRPVSRGHLGNNLRHGRLLDNPLVVAELQEGGRPSRLLIANSAYSLINGRGVHTLILQLKVIGERAAPAIAWAGSKLPRTLAKRKKGLCRMLPTHM